MPSEKAALATETMMFGVPWFSKLAVVSLGEPVT
jgi:hypothetical protein